MLFRSRDVVAFQPRFFVSAHCTELKTSPFASILMNSVKRVCRFPPHIPEFWAIISAHAVFVRECFVTRQKSFPFSALHFPILLIRIRERKFCCAWKLARPVTATAAKPHNITRMEKIFSSIQFLDWTSVACVRKTWSIVHSPAQHISNPS